jgi:hypothetical protein
VLLLALAVVALGWWVLQPQRLANLIEPMVGARLGGVVEIERAHLSWDGRLRLRELSLRVPGPGAELLHAETVHLRINRSALINGSVRLRQLRVDQPILHVTQDLKTGRFNFERLRPRESDGRLMPEHMPAITLNGGRVQFGEIDDGRYQPKGQLPVAGALNRMPRGDGQYEFVLRQLERRGEGDRPATQPRGDADQSGIDSQPTRLTGRLDTTSATIELTLHRFRFEGPQRNLLPARFRRWWDRLEPSGALPTMRAVIKPNAEGELRLHRAELKAEGLALTLPFDQIPPRYEPRMRQVSGHFTLAGDTIRIRDLTGLIEGIRYHMRGTVQGFGPDAPFTLHARTDPFTVPNNPPYLVAMPAVVQEQYGHFDPKGRFRAEVHLKRTEPGGTIQRDGLVEVLDGSLTFHKFAYPVQNMRGKLHFNNDRVLVNMRGQGPGGGQLSAHGLRIAPVRDGGGSEMTLVARDVPIDATLLDAMEPKHRKALRMFFSRKGRQQLIKRGAIAPASSKTRDFETSSEAREADAATATQPDAPPVLKGFTLGGRLPYVRVQLHRPVGEGKKPVVATTLYTRGLRGVFHHWPYPMTSTGGRLIIREGRVVVDRVTLRGPTGARAVIDGYVETPDSDGQGEIVPHLTIEHVRLPIDRLLKASLPEPQNQWLARLHVDGAITGQGRIFLNEAGKIDFKLAGKLEGGQARPFNAGYGLNDVSARFTLNSNGAELTQLTAHHGDATLSLTGEADWQREAVDFALQGKATALKWRPALIELLPPDHPMRDKLKELNKKWQPQGRFDAQLTLKREAGDSTADYRLSVSPKALGFHYGEHQFTFTDMKGSVQIRPGKIEFDELAGAYPDGRFSANGLVTLEEKAVALSFTAAGERIGPGLRAALPKAAVKAIDRFDFQSGFRIPSGRVRLDGEGGFEVQTKLELQDAAADLGAKFDRINGTITLDARRGPNQKWPQLDMQVDARTVQVWGQKLGPVRIELGSSQRDPARVRIKTLRGAMYGGRVIGTGRFDADSGAYQASLSLHDVRLPNLLSSESDGATPAGSKPTRVKPRATQPASAQSHGQLAARIAVADDGDPATPRTGRGALQIRDARLFREPLVLALLQTINFQLPMSRAFDRVSARFLLQDSTLRLNLLRFEAPTVAITGRGTMHLPDRQLDLTMFTRNPARFDLGAFSEAINVFKDELMCIRVTGTLDKPDAKHIGFRRLQQTWDAVMGGKSLPNRPNEPRPLPFRP